MLKHFRRLLLLQTLDQSTILLAQCGQGHVGYDQTAGAKLEHFTTNMGISK